jgi:biopolymer transport protein ExbD/biopolymer transport protein TolR
MGAPVATTGSRKRPLPEPEINVTPLVDVVLVLLIIFMVIAPQLEHGERVELPAVTNPDAKSKAKLDPITVTVTASGTLFLEKEKLEGDAELRARLAALAAESPDRRVVLKGDGSLPYSKMRAVFAACQDVGLKGVSLQVGQRGPSREES